jgi:hypothetical protein
MLRIPPPEYVETGARALRTVIAGDAPLPPAPAALIDAVARGVFGAPVTASALAPISADEVGATIPDADFRRQLVGAAIAMGMTVHPPDPAIPARARALAAALGVDEPMLAAFERGVQGHRYWMVADYARHSWAGEAVRQEVHERGVGAFAAQIARMQGHGGEDREVVARFAALEDLPAGSWGRGVFDFYARHRWPLPGQRGAVPLVTTHHDWVHVASGYEASPIGEIQVTAFMAAQMPDETALSMLFFGWSIYETGMLKVPLSPGAVGTIASDPQNPAQVADALRRGHESGVDLLDLDHWAHAHRPLEEVREEFHVGPKGLPGPDAAPAVPTVVSG